MKRLLIAAGAGGTLGAAMLHLLVVSPVSARAVRAETAASLCRAGEQPLFQCRIGRRSVALCAGGAGAGSYVQYRFGRPGHIELAYPQQGKAGLSWARVGYSGGGEMQVNFANADHRYVLYSRMVRTRFDGVNNDSLFQSGVAVIRGNRIVADHQCSDTDDPWIVEAPTERLLPEGEPADWSELEG